ncbi:MAG TPA: pyrroloquinoline quinone biosynthesis protein PqqB [Gemmatimonadales bacterium]|nr:pyrroloquinoline quinone biosynthesis protein PqqB [Gemmatimonadales bacterium]
MELVLLGTAAGGGFPQWNCWCPTCRVARTDPRRAHPRTQSSVAVSNDGRRWFLLNASPDVHRQLTRIDGVAPDGMRHVPVEGIVATDAELDHTLGVALLREARDLQLFASRAVLEVLAEDSRVLPVTQAFATVAITELPLEQAVPLRYRDGSDAGLRVTAFPVAGDPPRFARREVPGHTVGLMLEDGQGRAAFVPGCGALDAPLLDRLGRADLLLFDGTFWSDRELVDLGIGTRTARQMDHLPISGPEGSLAALSRLPCRQRVYTHINNSNPVLIEDSPERRAVESAGLVVGDDGMRFVVGQVA